MIMVVCDNDDNYFNDNTDADNDVTVESDYDIKKLSVGLLLLLMMVEMMMMMIVFTY